MNDDQAGSVSAGTVERRVPQLPRAISAARCGRRPLATLGAKHAPRGPVEPDDHDLRHRTSGRSSIGHVHGWQGRRFALTGREGRHTWPVRCVASWSPCSRGPRPSRTLRRRNVVFLLLDTTRADRLGALGNPHRPTPTLDALAQQGALFARHFANAHATRPSMPQLMTGRYYRQNILAPSGRASIRASGPSAVRMRPRRCCRRCCAPAATARSA